jgi:hypothetical protein
MYAEGPKLVLGTSENLYAKGPELSLSFACVCGNHSRPKWLAYAEGPQSKMCSSFVPKTT